MVAVEIIRQTPLNTLKFLDVLFINELLKHEIKKLQNSKPNNSAQKSHPSAMVRKRIDKKNSDIKFTTNYNSFCPIQRADETDFIKPNFAYFRPSNSFARVPDHPSNVDRMSKSCDSYDSGYCSLQSGSGKSDESPEPCPKIMQFEEARPKYFDEILRRFETNETKSKLKVKRSGSFRASVSSSCLNLINKFKKLNSRDGDNVSVKRSENLWKKRDGNQPNYAVVKANNGPSSAQPKVTRPMKYPRSCESVSNSINVKDKVSKNDQKLLKNSNFVDEKRGDRKLAKLVNNFQENLCQRTPVWSRMCKLSPQSDFGKFSEKVPKNRCTIAEVCREQKTGPKEGIRREPSEEPTCGSAYRKSSVTFELPEELLENEETNVLIRLLTKCQIDKQYVPVREKRMLFESLSRLSFSVDNLKKFKPKEDIARCNSLGDVSSIPVPVRVMKKYFENLKNENGRPVLRERSTFLSE